MKKRAKEYFLLADQYLETAKLTLEVLIENDNSNAGFGTTQEEAEKQMRENVLKSDVTLFIPTVFNAYQSTELFLKGLLLLNGKEITDTHEVSNMITEIKNIYTETSDVYRRINNFYNAQIEIIKNFKKSNNITTNKELYEALRYPENIKNNKTYDYNDLQYNGDIGIKNFELLRKRIQEVKDVILKEYNDKY